MRAKEASNKLNGKEVTSMKLKTKVNAGKHPD